MHAFLLSLALIFLAELGDKTQLVALALATRFNARIVLSDIFAATLLVHVLSVILGGVTAQLLPVDMVRFLASLAFIGFGFWTLRGDTLDTEENNLRLSSPFWVVTVTFFLAEFGDKTMLSTMTLATNYSALPVWIGSTLGMVCSDGLAIWVGQALEHRLPERTIKLGAAMIFFAFGLYGLVQSGVPLSFTAWGLGAVLFAVFLLLLSHRSA